MSVGPVASDAEILKARAREMAWERAPDEALDSKIEIVEFELAQERYGIETAYVREVQGLEDLTPIPGTPPFLVGLINVRGRILPVIDIKRFFELPDKGITDTHRVIVVFGQGIELGILADSVIGLQSVPHAAIQTQLSTLSGVRAEFLRGITKERLVILDIARILADRRIIVQEEAG